MMQSNWSSTLKYRRGQFGLTTPKTKLVTPKRILVLLVFYKIILKIIKMTSGLPKVLNVAEKNDAARELAKIMSRSQFQRVIQPRTYQYSLCFAERRILQV